MVSRYEIKTAIQADILDRLTKQFAFQRPGDPEADKPGSPILPPGQVMDVCLSRPAANYRRLTGLAASPFMRRDGTLCVTPGWDETTGLMLETPQDVLVAVLAIPAVPTKADAERALAVLDGLLEEFSFGGSGDSDDDGTGAQISCAVALAGLMTAVQRPALESAPMFLISAAQPGSGKSYLADIMSLIGTGQFPAPLSQTGNDDEFNKRVDTAFLSGRPFILIDNIKRPLDCDTLEQALTANEIEIRGFKTQKGLKATTRTIVVGTGNNLTTSADMLRRSVLCYLNPAVDRPEEIQFKFNPRLAVAKDRGRYVAAVLTILRAYHVASYPGAVGLGSFDQWSRLIRSSLLWLGRADPRKSVDDLRTADPFRIETAELYEVWAEEIKGRPITVKKLIGEQGINSDSETHAKVLSHIHSVFGLRQLTALTVAGYLRRRRGVVCGKYQLLSVLDSHSKVQLWQLSGVIDG